MDLINMTNTILQKIPQNLIPNAEEGIIIRQYTDFFKNHEETLISAFYDIIFSDDSTRVHMDAAERPMREGMLRHWYQVTTKGYFDENYWAWQALVGIVHVKHNIPNSAVIGMWSWMINFLQERLFAELPQEEALKVSYILQKLQATVCSLIIESFISTQQEAIARSSGLNQTILGRFIQIEINNLLKQGRTLLQSRLAPESALAA